MKARSILVGAAVFAASTLFASGAAAQAPAPCTYTSTLGLGGALTGCFTFTMSELGENAGFRSDQYYWNGNFTSATGAPINAPNPAGTKFFDDDCGSNGNFGYTNFRFCTGTSHTMGPVANASGELVLGLFVPDRANNPANLGYWIFSGDQNRNAYPTPTGFQSVLYQMTLGGNVVDGEYLFAWEDIDTGCTATTGSALHPSLSTYAFEDLGNAQILDNPNNCTGGIASPSDGDYNDSYIRLSITGTRLDIVPEPMTMTLMATGLIGLAGAQFRRRRKTQG